MKFSELEVVRVLKDFEKEGIRKGDFGTIVHIFTQPTEAYEVEFCDKEGRTVAEFTVLPEYLEKY
ncbi:DUF4926 domain-containing protein [Paenibacillus sp. SI8]|uniref:DUF4926 domain-containing protein n=1 Tax=unclassified Paenibacillus TaxID=185978 RepID=UPI003465F746